MGAGKGAGVHRAAGKRLLEAVRAAVATVWRVTCILTHFIPSAAQVTAANVCLCGAVVLRAVVLRVPAGPGVDLTGLETRDLF